jgi:protein phosphatase
MVICPHCNTENRPEAAFCARCGAILIAPGPSAGVVDTNASKEPSTQPIFSERPGDSTFGDRFRCDSLIYKDDHEIRYAVKEICGDQGSCFRICSNPDCRTIHTPTGDQREKFCTQCGQPLQEQALRFLLRESSTPIFGNPNTLIERNLAHPHVHAPIAYFKENLPTGPRYCLVTPFYRDLPPSPEQPLVLEWGMQLASALTYLHENGVTFGGQVNSSCFGMDENQVVWCNFSTANVPTELIEQSQPADVRSLALTLYLWLTGKTTFSDDPNLHPRLNDLFREALVGTGFGSGIELAQKIASAHPGCDELGSVDILVGRRTNLGKVRTLNEDSLVTIELSRTLQCVVQPLGVFAIADGMGGHSAGELASGSTINTISQKAFTELPPLKKRTPDECTQWLKQTIEAANRNVFELRQKAGTDMGSTVVLALLEGCQAYLAHVGDSRIYRINANGIQQLTIDHSLVQRLVDTGQISREDARRHPQRNVIYRTIGDRPEVEVDISSHTLSPGDRLLLCSDGLTGMVEDKYLHKIIMEASSPQDASDRLIDAANLGGGDDNISVIVVELIAA